MEDFDSYGRDQYYGQNGPSEAPGFPLKLFKGKWVSRMTIAEVTSRQESEIGNRRSNKIKAFLSRVYKNA